MRRASDGPRGPPRSPRSSMLRRLAAVAVLLAGPLGAAAQAPANVIQWAFSQQLLFPDNIWRRVEASLVVPEVPPVPDPANAGSYFLWAGLQPGPPDVTTNFLPIGNGVLQSVATFGPSCAPGQPAQGSPYRGWASSSEYVNLNTSLTAYQGCRGGPFMDANPGDRLRMKLWFVGSDGPNRSIWRQTIERFDAIGQPLPCLPTAFGDGTPCSVGYEMQLLGQEQRWAQLAVEWAGRANQSFFRSITFEDIRLVANDSEPQFCGFLRPDGEREQGAFGKYLVTGNSGCDGLELVNRTTCLIRRCMWTGPGVPRPPPPTTTTTVATATSTATSTPTNTGVPPPPTSWFNGLTSGAQAGFIIGMVLLGLLVLGLLGYLLYRNSKKKKVDDADRVEVNGEKSTDGVSGIKEKGENGADGAAAAAAAAAASVQRPTSVAMPYGYPGIPIFVPPGADGDPNGRPVSMYSVSYGGVPYLAIGGAPPGTRTSMASQGARSNRPLSTVQEEDVATAVSAANLAVPGNRNSFPAAPAAAAVAPRPRSMFVPTSGGAGAPARPLTGSWDAYGNFLPHMPVLMAAQQPIFVGPDGGYYVAGDEGMKKVNAPPGYYPAPPLVFVPDPSAYRNSFAGPDGDEDGEEESEASSQAPAPAPVPATTVSGPRASSMKGGKEKSGNRLSVQLPAEDAPVPAATVPAATVPAATGPLVTAPAATVDVASDASAAGNGTDAK
ncbi:hypothetical protein DFJ74DRAFT_756003 [Hyaloraphidium curvatum]|nr:hypothetical protein DFJ74DRAFT_756003 [Hyaloraphidium curvatum]